MLYVLNLNWRGLGGLPTTEQAKMFVCAGDLALTGIRQWNCVEKMIDSDYWHTVIITCWKKHKNIPLNDISVIPVTKEIFT